MEGQEQGQEQEQENGQGQEPEFQLPTHTAPSLDALAAAGTRSSSGGERPLATNATETTIALPHALHTCAAPNVSANIQANILALETRIVAHTVGQHEHAAGVQQQLKGLDQRMAKIEDILSTLVTTLGVTGMPGVATNRIPLPDLRKSASGRRL
jgi:hypothetical protein